MRYYSLNYENKHTTTHNVPSCMYNYKNPKRGRQVPSMLQICKMKIILEICKEVTISHLTHDHTIIRCLLCICDERQVVGFHPKGISRTDVLKSIYVLDLMLFFPLMYDGMQYGVTCWSIYFCFYLNCC